MQTLETPVVDTTALESLLLAQEVAELRKKVKDLKGMMDFALERNNRRAHGKFSMAYHAAVRRLERIEEK